MSDKDSSEESALLNANRAEDGEETRWQYFFNVDDWTAQLEDILLFYSKPWMQSGTLKKKKKKDERHTKISFSSIIITRDCCGSCSVDWHFAQRWTYCYERLHAGLTSPCVHASRWQTFLQSFYGWYCGSGRFRGPRDGTVVFKRRLFLPHSLH